GVVHFGETLRTTAPAARAEAPDPDVMWTLLGLTSPGGFVVLGGSAARLVRGLAERMGGVHFVGVNPPPDVEVSPVLTLLAHPDRIPLRRSMDRGVGLGADACRAPW